MRSIGFAAGIAIAIIVTAFILDAWLSVPAYAYLLLPGYVAVGYLDRHAVISAFDSSGDLALTGIVVAGAVNFLFWLSIGWLALRLTTSRKKTFVHANR